MVFLFNSFGLRRTRQRRTAGNCIVRSFLICIPTKNFRDDPIRKDGDGLERGTCGEAFCWGNPEEQDNLEDLGIDVKTSERTLTFW